jgi:hypothetical protein
MIEYLNKELFTWNKWRAFNLFRPRCLKDFKNLIKPYIIGYSKADDLLCRPKADHYAIMFLKDDIFSWCHITKKEFEDYVAKTPARLVCK